MRRQWAARGLGGKLSCYRYWPGRQRCLPRFGILERQLELSDLGVKLLGGAAELHALQARELKAQLLDLDVAGDQDGLRGLESSLLLEDETLERLDVVRQIIRLAHAALYRMCAWHTRLNTIKQGLFTPRAADRRCEWDVSSRSLQAASR